MVNLIFVSGDRCPYDCYRITFASGEFVEWSSGPRRSLEETKQEAINDLVASHIPKYDIFCDGIPVFPDARPPKVYFRLDIAELITHVAYNDLYLTYKKTGMLANASDMSGIYGEIEQILCDEDLGFLACHAVAEKWKYDYNSHPVKEVDGVKRTDGPPEDDEYIMSLAGVAAYLATNWAPTFRKAFPGKVF